MTVAVNKLANGTIELTITIAWGDIKTTYDQVIDRYVAETELPGFRKGKAPRSAVEEKLDKTKVYEEVLKQIVPKTYTEAVKQENLKPVIAPQVEIIAAAVDQDWQFKAKTCEMPPVKLGNYQEEIDKLRSGKKTKIWTPGQPKTDDKINTITLDELVKLLLQVNQVQIPDLLIEDEVNRMLSRLIDQTQKLGLTVEQYLLSQGKTSDGLKSEYRVRAGQNLAAEFILEAIADQEKIEVSPEEIEKILDGIKDPTQKETLSKQKFYLESVIRRQKTLTKLNPDLNTESAPVSNPSVK